MLLYIYIYINTRILYSHEELLFFTDSVLSSSLTSNVWTTGPRHGINENEKPSPPPTVGNKSRGFNHRPSRTYIIQDSLRLSSVISLSLSLSIPSFSVYRSRVRVRGRGMCWCSSIVAAYGIVTRKKSNKVDFVLWCMHSIFSFPNTTYSGTRF